MLGLAPDYDHLMVIQKVEVFEHALESTSGEDLHKVRRPGAAGWAGNGGGSWATWQRRGKTPWLRWFHTGADYLIAWCPSPLSTNLSMLMVC